MAGPSFDASQFAALVVDTGTEVAADAYDRVPELYREFCEVVSPADISHPFEGDKSTTVVSGAKPRERKPGAPVSYTTIGQGYTPQGRVRSWSAAISVPERQAAALAANPKNLYGSIIGEFAREFGVYASNLKNRLVAESLVKGCLTAGSLELFDGSFVGNDDPYPKFGYDGLPWFDTAHPIKFGSTTYSNHVASAALSATTLDSAYTTFTSTNAVDEAGERISNPAEVLLVPAGLRSTAMTLLESQNLPGGALNDINTNRGLLRAVVNPFLDEFDSDGWFLIGQRRTIRVIDSGVPVIESWYDNETKSMKVSAEVHFSLYLRDWRGALARNIAAA